LKTPWNEYGFTDEELAILMGVDAHSGDETIGLYIEAERRSFYDEYYAYLRENGVDPFLY